MKRHKFDMMGSYFELARSWGYAFSAANPSVRRAFRNWPCGACGLWKRAKVHR